MSVKDFFSKILAFFKSDEFKAAKKRAEELAPVVLPFVKQAAELTANPFDDAAVEFIERTTGYSASPNPAAMEGLVKVAVRSLVRKEVPNLNDSDRIIDAAIQLAYIAYRIAAPAQ